MLLLIEKENRGPLISEWFGCNWLQCPWKVTCQKRIIIWSCEKGKIGIWVS
jgi:hypothetical protein